MPTGKTSSIEDALHYRLRQLTLSPTRRVAWPKEPFTPTIASDGQGEIFLRPTVFWNETERGEIGPGAARRHMGIYQIEVRAPTGLRSFAQEEIADLLIEHFDRQVISRNGLLVRIGTFNGGPAVPWRTTPIPDGAWQTIPVSCPFWCDAFPS